jgi:hypothetical protein
MATVDRAADTERLLATIMTLRERSYSVRWASAGQAYTRHDDANTLVHDDIKSLDMMT